MRRLRTPGSVRGGDRYRPAPARPFGSGRGRSVPTEPRRERAADLVKVVLPGLARPGAQVTGDCVEEVGRGDAAPVHERLLEVPARAPWSQARRARRPAAANAVARSTGIFGAGPVSCPRRRRPASQVLVALAASRRPAELLLSGDSPRHPDMFRIIFQAPYCTFLYRQVSYRPRERYGGASPFMLDRGTGVSGSPKQVPWLAPDVPVHSTTTEPIAALQQLQGSH